MSIAKASFGEVDGVPVTRYVLESGAGVTVAISSYGATMISVKTPDRNGRAWCRLRDPDQAVTGKIQEITNCFDNVQQYAKKHPYFGSTVGRVANRIAKGKFSLDGKEYQLNLNNGPNHLHGGPNGFHKMHWKEVKAEKTAEGPTVVLSYFSRDGEENYPGNLSVTLTYVLKPTNELHIRFSAITDIATPVNLTNHTYWNLGGCASGTIFSHEMQILADHYLPVDDTLIPTGKVQSVSEVPAMDFTSPRSIGARIAETSGGYDHCYVLRTRDPTGTPTLAARVYEPSSGRVLEVLNTQPCIQFYSGNFLDGSLKKHSGFCLESQAYVNALNQPSWPSIILRPGSVYDHKIIYRFSTQ